VIDERYTIETPENISFDYDIAGIGSRFLAAIIDTILILLALGLTSFILGNLSDLLPFTGDVLLAISVIVSFIILWTYYLVFEVVWNGQSPGKRLIGLRVVREGGRPITFLSSAIRNLIRFVDFLPFFYGIGVVAMFIDLRARRLGDLVGGTLVVKERSDVTLASLTTPTTAVRSTTIATANTISLPNLDLLTTRDYDLAHEFLQRRNELSPEARQKLAQQLASGLQARIGVPQDLVHAESFLLLLVSEYQFFHRQREAGALGETPK
jgi:uncharacterized RDD family membrane protein YckC